MKTKYIIPLFALAIGLLSCDNWYTEHQLNHPTPDITNVRSIDYTLTDADYKAIAENEQNKQLALDIDQDGAVYDLLLSVRDLKYFPEGADADVFIPAWLKNKYPHLSKQSFLNVTYRSEIELPKYLSDFAKMSEVTLDEVFTPATIGQLTEKLSDGTEGEIRIVNYQYQDVVLQLCSKVYQFKNAAWNEYSHTGVNVVVIPQEVYDQQDSQTLADAGRVIPLYLSNTYPYTVADAVYAVIYRAKNGLTVDEYVFDGLQWNKTINVENTTLAFENKGGYWEANISLYLSEPFTDGQGAFTIQDVLLTDPLTYVWKFDARYGMKATAYVGGNHASESWLVSPTLKFKNAVHPVLTFDQASKYAASFTDEVFVMVSTDYAGDVTTATWTHVPFNQDDHGECLVPDGASWDFIPTGELDLSAFIGNKVTIGFKYTSSDAASATWEIKNVRVEEASEKTAD